MKRGKMSSFKNFLKKINKSSSEKKFQPDPASVCCVLIAQCVVRSLPKALAASLPKAYRKEAYRFDRRRTLL
jgi:hypothetical protein